MIKTNVVKLGDFRELLEVKKGNESYRRYLSTLANSQLENEIHFLLDEFSMDTYGKDFSHKVRLVQDEIVMRADSDWKERIITLNKDTLQLI